MSVPIADAHAETASIWVAAAVTAMFARVGLARVDVGTANAATNMIAGRIELKALSIPAHWLRLAGELLAESQGADYEEVLSCPDDWPAAEFVLFRDSIFAWLNETLSPASHYGDEDHVLLWMATGFLGELLKDDGVTFQPADAFSTQSILVTP